MRDSSLYRERERCERARTWVSLGLDGELSELEGAMFDSHLAQCPACRRFALDATAFTAALRAQPLEAAKRPVTLSRQPRRIRLRTLEVAAAALVTVAVGVAGLAGSLRSDQQTPQVDLRLVPERSLEDDTVDVVAARRANLLATTSRAWVPRRGVRLSES